MLRLFFALNAGLEQSQVLTHEVAPLVSELQAQAVPAQNLHATLCFVGAIEPAKLDALRAAAAGVRAARATLTFDALERWQTPKILCATAKVDGAAPKLQLGARVLGCGFVGAGLAHDGAW